MDRRKMRCEVDKRGGGRIYFLLPPAFKKGKN
jgi:hypothetical protein